MSYDMTLTPMGIIAKRVARDNNWAPYSKAINPFSNQPRSLTLEFASEYLNELSRHERERTGYY